MNDADRAGGLLFRLFRVKFASEPLIERFFVSKLVGLFRDGLGFTADLVAGVWLGNDNNSPMNKVTGGMLPAATWRNFMLAATKGTPVRPLPAPAAPAALTVSDAAAPAAAEESPLDRLFGWLGDQVRPAAGPAPIEAGRYLGPAARD